MSFWLSGTGMAPTGRPEDAFIGEYPIIPNGTVATASIKSFVLINKEQGFDGRPEKYYQIVYKLLDGEFKSREVTQKIKCFDGKPEQIQRGLNMLKLIMQLCEFKPTHNDAPQDLELMPMLNKIVSVKIGEWFMENKKTGKDMNGNNIREVHASGAIPTETGVKAVVERKPTSSVESAFSRNAAMPVLEADLPF